ncbi:unnamed protein product [Lasius platythorax]|uniref:Uncharacterized protein n=1 Tax=Lasius platythorax TaxID=488582 RepID=A0AAV2MZT1_9HYME
MTKNTVDELVFALKMKFQASGNTDGAAILSFFMEKLEESSKLRAYCEGKRFEVKIYSRAQALALILNLDLSRSKYDELRHMSKALDNILRIIKFD